MKTSQKAALALAILFIFAVLISQVFVIEEADHDCSGEVCPICKIIAFISSTFNKLLVLVSYLLICLIAIIGNYEVCDSDNCTAYTTSPVSLKVKLSN